MTTSALDTNQAKTIGIVAIVVIVAIGLVVGVIVQAIVGRLIVVAVVIGLGIFLWTQRLTIEDHVKKCDSNVTFLGIHVKLSGGAEQTCQQRH